MTKKEKDILDKLAETLQGYENECWQQMRFLRENNLNVECEAVRLRQQAYNRSKLEVLVAINKIKDITKKS